MEVEEAHTRTTLHAHTKIKQRTLNTGEGGGTGVVAAWEPSANKRDGMRDGGLDGHTRPRRQRKRGAGSLCLCILCSSQHLRTPASVVSPLPLPTALATGRGPLSRRHHPLHARRRGMVACRFERLPERPRHPAALLACPRARPVDRGQQVRHGPGGALEGGVGRAAPRGEERLQLPRPISSSRPVFLL